MMARCIFVVSLLAWLFSSCLGATLQDRDAQLIRSEGRSVNKRVYLSSLGELALPKDGGSPDPKVEAVQEQVEQTDANEIADEDSLASSDYCDIDFPLGNPDTDTCRNGTTNAFSDLDTDMCEWAAKMSHAKIETDKFRVMEGSTLWGKVHPRGCFKSTCFHSGPVCYYYNDETDTPDSADGQPVCQRPRYLNGSAAPLQQASCPDDEYSVIMDEKQCRRAANCLGYCQGHEFRSTAIVVSNYDMFPEGCFIHADLKNQSGIPCVYFNAPNNASAFPATPEGTPICKVTSPTNFSSGV